ncbi:hypothetical protein AGABI2DRAFT_192954 [Agaricus bisporus var. bisporus H97]|uniref:hypothetical protein n=1 Tax=Agaricus bisporus var. bisporus (strain H97 / ATCC MYA-4626 / FGSC 10389) TaxID=936046 RepID=UPI00029F5CAC|nr:hypothetical protein AGABI2DRAFT_192954 [Agaricus bisporus var. bisporus H97]EKV47800.1 hypothetical protein AGABI2DRAFT_192954 [Agaricus bisporus var. bisporus H97]
MLNTTYLPHALYSIAITSISIHLVGQKRTIAEDRARIAARISTLESVAGQLRDGKHLSLEELDRLQRLARPPSSSSAERVQPIREEIGWRETIFGRKRSLETEMSEYDRRDWEKVRKEIEKEA